MNYIFNDSTMSSLDKSMFLVGLFFISFAIFCVTPYGQTILDFIGVIAVLILGFTGFILLVLLSVSESDPILSQHNSNNVKSESHKQDSVK